MEQHAHVPNEVIGDVPGIHANQALHGRHDSLGGVRGLLDWRILTGRVNG